MFDKHHAFGSAIVIAFDIALSFSSSVGAKTLASVRTSRLPSARELRSDERQTAKATIRTPCFRLSRVMMRIVVWWYWRIEERERERERGGLKRSTSDEVLRPSFFLHRQAEDPRRSRRAHSDSAHTVNQTCLSVSRIRAPTTNR